jgi:HSP20 family protein
MNTLSKNENRVTGSTQNGTSRVSYLTPLANILETGDGYVLEAEMPGVSKDGLQITVENGELVILGRRTAYESPGTQLYGETRPVDYRRAFEIDPSIDAARITAKMDQGVLTLTLPKAEAVKPRKFVVPD